LALPSFRDRIPVILDNVTTICGPGPLIDVIITERGIAINPLRKDLLKATKNSSLPIRPIREIKAEVESLVGGAPEKHVRSKEPVAVVKWVDGTLLDAVWKVE
jgi:citrate lyase subunit alpha/citrate CoA-transferase